MKTVESGIAFPIHRIPDIARRDLQTRHYEICVSIAKSGQDGILNSCFQIRFQTLVHNLGMSVILEKVLVQFNNMFFLEMYFKSEIYAQ